MPLTESQIKSLKFDDLDDEEMVQFPDREDLTPAQRSKIAANHGLISSWLNAVSGRVLQDALSGQPTPGLKAVVGRKGPRAWRDEMRAKRFLLRYLDDKAIWSERKLISPTQASKLLPKERGESEEKKCKSLDDWRELGAKRGYKPGWALVQWRLR